VDDLTAWFRGLGAAVAPAAVAALALTHDFARACQLDVHPTKTVLFGSSPAVRARLRGLAPEAVVVDEFRDLGVGQAIGARAAPKVAVARAAATQERFRRLMALPLSYPARLRAVASAGVSAACWGARASTMASAAGTPRTTQACATLQDITAREIGFPVNPHLIRSLVGDIVEALHPGAIGLTRDILGHKTVATTEAHYRRRRSRDSRERYHGDLEHRLRGSI
jgi:hypothetical protein